MSPLPSRRHGLGRSRACKKEPANAARHPHRCPPSSCKTCGGEKSRRSRCPGLRQTAEETPTKITPATPARITPSPTATGHKTHTHAPPPLSRRTTPHNETTTATVPNGARNSAGINPSRSGPSQPCCAQYAAGIRMETAKSPATPCTTPTISQRRARLTHTTSSTHRCEQKTKARKRFFFEKKKQKTSVH